MLRFSLSIWDRSHLLFCSTERLDYCVEVRKCLCKREGFKLKQLISVIKYLSSDILCLQFIYFPFTY